MKFYLIDYENVPTFGFDDLIDISKKDRVIIFYSDKCPKMPLEVMDSFAKMKIKYEVYKIAQGRANALDFQLSSYLGYLIHKCDNKTDKLFIVSNDKGYDCLKDFWAEKKYQVERIGIVRETGNDGKTLCLPKNPSKKPAITISPNAVSEADSPSVTSDEKKSVQNSVPDKQNDKPKLEYEELLEYIAEEEASLFIVNVFNDSGSKNKFQSRIAKVLRNKQKAMYITSQLAPLFKKYKKHMK